MLFSDSYYTIKNKAEGIYKEKGSKFLAYAYRVNNENEIKEHLQELKKMHPSSRHVCYAYRLGADKQQYRINDDGEPSGTAGKPIFAVIQSNDLSNILIAVVRYFGGTLLGVSGLIQAYKGAAADAIAQATIEEVFIYFQYKLIFTVNEVSLVMKTCKEVDAEIIQQDYDTEYTMIVNVKKLNSEKFEEKIKLIYNAKLSYLKTL
ncbi:MAG: YigZ family protein [Bacteroidia bacterium]|nr:YigZ family protein [Bacteroidia bacterium]